MNWIKSSKQQVMYQAASILLIISMVFGWVFGINVPKAYACYTWQVGQRVGLKGGAEIRYGSGFAYAVHTIVPNDNWQVDIIGGPRYADGQEWWDISREALDGGGTGWVYKAQAGYDICQPPSPGNIYVASGLELQPDPNHSWPPYEGDKLIGRFTLGNNGGQTVHLEGYGVRMRRNGSEYWDFLNMSGRDLGPGQTVRFDQNNERPLATGHYRAEITWKVSGQDWQVADAREFDVSARPGNIYVASGLELQPDPNHSWPPYEGDKLIGRFTLGNNGGQTVHLEGYGVRMRRNGSEYWDFLNMSGRDLGPGQTVRFDQNNERPLTTGHYRAEITWKVSGQDWQVADAREFDVSARPSNIYVASGLEMQPDPNHSWPPYEGDKLIGRFTLGNNGGQTVHLEGYGVRMRRNGSEYWDFLNMSGRDLGPGQTVRFDQNNERPLVAGHYRAEITWKVSGQDWQVADAREFDVSALQPGRLELVDNLTLRSDGSGAWPPRVGDKLIAHIKVRNAGDQNLHVEHIGVRGRRNGSENWDIGWWTIDLGGHQEWSLDPNNARPLEAGSYSFRISYSLDGNTWNEIGNEVNFTVEGTTQSGDRAQFVSQSNYPTVPPGQSLLIWFKVRNTGSTTWTAAEDYYLSNINGQPLGAPSRLELSTSVPPQATYRWNIVVHAPSTPGVYRTQWMMKHGSSTFGPNMYIDVTVSSNGASQIPDLRIISGPNITPASPIVGQQVESTFVVRNFGSTSASVRQLGLGGRGPLGASDVEDFPMMQGISLAPGQEYVYTSQRRFTRDGTYTFFPVFQTWDGQWIEIRGSSGNRLTRYISVGRSTNPSIQSIETHYDTNSREVVDIQYTELRPDPDGSITTNIVIINKKWVTLAARFNNIGSPPVGVDSQGILNQEYVVIVPTRQYGGVYSGGYVIRDVKFWPGSKLNVIFSAWGYNQGPPEPIHDTGVLMVMNGVTMLCGAILHDKCPSNNLDIDLDIFLGLLNLMSEYDSNAVWLQIGTKMGLSNPDFWGALQLILEFLKTSPELVVKIVSKLNIPGISTLTVKKVFGAPMQIILAMPSLFQFAWDFGGTKWWGVSEVNMVPSTRPSVTEANALSGVEQSEADLVALSGSIQGNTVVASSSEFGPGWEFYTLVDNNYYTGWGNGSITNTNDQWVTIQLANGKPVTINQVRIHPGPTGSDPIELALKEFRVESSLNGVDFSPLLEGEFSSSEVGLSKTFSVQPTLANYLKFHALSNQGGGNAGLLSVAEVEVFGDVGLAGDMFEQDSHFTSAKWMPTTGEQFQHTFSYPRDVDWVQFEAQEGVTYTIQTSNLGPNADTILQLYDQDATTFLVSDDDSGEGLASQIIWTAPASGIYYLLVRQYDPDIGGSGTNYNLSISPKGQGGTVYLPILMKNSDGTVPPPAKVLSGVVTDRSIPVVGTEILLRYYDGSAWSTYATKTTDANGYYQFTNLPNIGAEQSMYVRWNNTNYDPSRLWLWRCWYITSSNLDDPNAYQCNFDLENTELLSPNPGATVSLPYTFTWNRRAITTDSYELNLADMNSDDLWWWTDPPLGYVDNYTLNSLPAGFVPGQQYGWWLWVYGPGVYGVSYYYYTITFSNMGTGLEIQAMPAGHRAMEDMESFAPPISR